MNSSPSPGPWAKKLFARVTGEKKICVLPTGAAESWTHICLPPAISGKNSLNHQGSINQKIHIAQGVSNIFQTYSNGR